MIFCGVWYPAGLCSAGSDTPLNFVKQGIRPLQDVLLWGIRPRRTSVCFKIYTTLPLFCGVWYPARLSFVGTDTTAGSCSAWSDTPQDFVLRGIRPCWQIKTPQNRTKQFWELAILFKGTLFKNPTHIRIMLKEPPIWKTVSCSAGADTPQNNF
jgi:hypothetical protein